MRTQSFRQAANLHIKLDKQGKYQYRKHRAYVIHKMIDDLCAIRQVPASWQALDTHHIQQLVHYWKRKKINPVTIMRYMTIIRRFLTQGHCHVTDIDNQSLDLIRPVKKRKRVLPIQNDVWQSLNEPFARLIMALQTEFGLTFREAIHLIPQAHVRTDDLWITRDIAFNSSDRIIPIRTSKQQMIIDFFNRLTEKKDCLITIKSYEEIRLLWRNTLKKQRLSSTKSWRYLYAKQMYDYLLSEYGNYKTCLLIRDEMGIKSRNTLWLYLKD